MSNESSRPNADPEKIVGKTANQNQEATELNLWDLDFGETGDASAEEITQPEEEYPGQSEEPEGAGEETAEPETKEKTKPSLDTLSALASLSKVEKIAISCLVAALALGATLTFVHFNNRVPTRPLLAEEIVFPVTGGIVEITSASTYWRKPVTTGANADVVRRGTQLIPVLKLKISAKSGVIRVFFRNEEGLVVGDAITRTVKGETEITIAATAGFEDIGMHTAYRTGDSLPWVAQVFEGPDATAPREKFSKVLETEISKLIR